MYEKENIEFMEKVKLENELRKKNIMKWLNKQKIIGKKIMKNIWKK